MSEHIHDENVYVTYTDGWPIIVRTCPRGWKVEMVRQAADYAMIRVNDGDCD